MLKYLYSEAYDHTYSVKGKKISCFSKSEIPIFLFFCGA